MAEASTDLVRLDGTPDAAALLTTPVAGMPAEVRTRPNPASTSASNSTTLGYPGRAPAAVAGRA